MSTPSRTETNFCRLLGQCNCLVSGGKLDDWRLENYVVSLDTMLSGLKGSLSRPKDEVLVDYAKQVEFLKGVLHANKLPSPAEKALASQLLTAAAGGHKLAKEIQLKTAGKYATEMRKELLESAGLKKARSNSWLIDGLRHRPSAAATAVEPVDSQDYDVMLRYHQNMQEKIADEMVLLARNLKENSLLTGSIIRKDTEMLEKSNKLADQNYDRLKVEGTRLEAHAHKGCNWWIWIMLLVVCTVFVFMVFFMKLFKKS